MVIAWKRLEPIKLNIILTIISHNLWQYQKQHYNKNLGLLTQISLIFSSDKNLINILQKQ